LLSASALSLLLRERDLGLLDTQLLQHLGDLVADVFRAIVGVETVDLKRKLSNHHLQHRQQIRLAEPLHAGLHLPLTHRIHTGDVVNPLDAVQVALGSTLSMRTQPARPLGLGALRTPMGLHTVRVLVKFMRRTQ